MNCQQAYARKHLIKGGGGGEGVVDVLIQATEVTQQEQTTG